MVPIWCYFCFVSLSFSPWKSHLRGHFSTKDSLNLELKLAFPVNFCWMLVSPQFDDITFGFPSHGLIHSFLGHVVSNWLNDVTPGSFCYLLFILLLLLVINLINWLIQIQIQMPNNCISFCGPYRTHCLSNLFHIFKPNSHSCGNDGLKWIFSVHMIKEWTG